MRMMKMFTLVIALGFGGAVGAEPAAAGEQELHETMQKGADELHSMPMTGDLDHDFVWAMKKHHQDAIDMARVLLKYGKAPRTRQLAQKIIDSRTKEIAELDEWMAKHHQPMK